MIERDERPLNEIQFALDVKDAAERERIAVQIRGLFALCGVKVAQDIIELGCTGLVQVRHAHLLKTHWGEEAEHCPPPGVTRALEEAIFIRENMAGSICGLPCYVPPDRFCLVHKTVGALQLQGNQDGPQLLRHPEGVPFCSRELTDEEAKEVGAIRTKLLKDAEAAAKDLGYQPTDLETEAHADDPLAATSKKPSTIGGSERDASCGSSGFASFVCPEHPEFNPACRFCLAQAVAEGPLQPEIKVIAWGPGASEERQVDPQELAKLLAHNGDEEVRLFVRAARWVRKLTRE